MPLYLAKVTVTRIVNTEWEHDAKDADAAQQAAHAFAESIWPDAEHIEVSIEPIKVIDTD